MQNKQLTFFTKFLEICPVYKRGSHQRHINWGFKDVNSDNIRIGEIAEQQAIAWFMAHGYEVFRNVCRTGPVDLIVVKKSKTILIDVKVPSAWIRDDDTVITKPARKRENQKNLPILFFYVAPFIGCSFNYVDLGPMIQEKLNISHLPIISLVYPLPKHQRSRMKVLTDNSFRGIS